MHLEELERLRDGYFNLEVELAKSETRRQKAETQRDDLLAVLEAVEWHDSGCEVPISECPWCHNAPFQGHRDDCERQAAIA